MTFSLLAQQLQRQRVAKRLQHPSIMLPEDVLKHLQAVHENYLSPQRVAVRRSCRPPNRKKAKLNDKGVMVQGHKMLEEAVCSREESEVMVFSLEL